MKQDIINTVKGIFPETAGDVILSGTSWDITASPIIEKTLTVNTSVSIINAVAGKSKGVAFVKGSGYTLSVNGQSITLNKTGYTRVTVYMLLDSTIYIFSDATNAVVTTNTGTGTGTPPDYPSIPVVNGLVWYVDPSASSNGNGKGDQTLGLNQVGSTGGTPFNSMAAVKSAMLAGTIGANHQVLFKRGTSAKMIQSWSGFNYNGTYLKFGAYGPTTNPNPMFEYDLANAGTTLAKDRTMIYSTSCSYIYFENIRFTDSTMAVNNHTTLCNVGYGFAAADSASHHWFFNGCSFDRLGEGGEVHGHDHVFVNCSFYDMRYQRDQNNSADFGAVGITCSTSTDTTFYNCLFRDCYGKSQFFGWDGGCVEVIGDCSRLKMQYCTMINCEGIIEAGNGSVLISDVFFAFNLCVNNARALWMNFGSGQPTYSNWQYFNNTFIEQLALGNTTPYPIVSGKYRIPYGYIFAIGGVTGTSNVLNERNNIYYIIDSGMKVVTANMATGTQITSRNNAYRMPDPTKIGYPITDGGTNSSGNAINGEVNLGTASLFTDISSTDPTQWNIMPVPGSAVIDAGANLSGVPVNATMPTQDMNGNFVPNGTLPDIGAVEYYA